jgi:hypothetical protein
MEKTHPKMKMVVLEEDTAISSVLGKEHGW